MPTVLIRTPHGGPWLELRHPVATIVASRPDGVSAALAGVEQVTRQGYLAAGFVTYEAAAGFGLPTQPAPRNLPLVWFGVFRAGDAIRHPSVPAGWRDQQGPLAWRPSIDQARYTEAVAGIRQHIADGNTYQLNYTFRMGADATGDPRTLFAALADAQGGPWSAFIDTGDLAVCSASPELFFERDGVRIVTRPMKGTAPRGRWPEEDAARAESLTASPKNLAENVMIVDLMRNDLGRIARPGSVRVSDMFHLERYPAQWQMTSTVEAELRPETTLVEIFAALFPSGSITGAPKIRSMDILRQVETGPRGVYCGAVGLVEPGGRAHFNVAIRTVAVDRASGRAEFGVGSGIVWDSEADAEFEECRVKATILTTPSPDFSLIESLRWEPGTGYTLLERHRARLRDSAAYFGIPFDPLRVETALTDVASRLTEPSKVRLLVSRAGEVDTAAQPLGSTPSPMRIALAPMPVSSQDVWLFHKTTERAAYQTAEAACPGVDAVLLWNERGEVTEATNFNLVAEIDGRRVTPPLDCGLLAGTFRAELLATGAITEAIVRVDDLRRATRLWLINSVRGWVEAEQV